MNLDRWPDRRFLWGVLSTLRRECVDKYVDEAVRQRDQLHMVNRMNTKSINITSGWRAKLLEHDFASRKKGK